MSVLTAPCAIDEKSPDGRANSVNLNNNNFFLGQRGVIRCRKAINANNTFTTINNNPGQRRKNASIVSMLADGGAPPPPTLEHLECGH